MADPVLQISPNPGLIPPVPDSPVSKEPVGYTETPDSLTTNGYADQPAPINVQTPSGHVISFAHDTPPEQVQQHTQDWWDRMTDAAYTAVGHFVPESATGPLKAGMDYYVNPTNQALKKVGDVAVASVQGPNYGPKTRAYLRSQSVNPDGPMPESLKGVNEESIRFASQTLADPRMWPFFGEKLAVEAPAVGRQILNRALAGTIASNASKDVVNTVRDLAKNWSTMTSKEKSAALTGATLSSVMAGLTGYHTVMGSPVSPTHVDHPVDVAASVRPAPVVTAPTGEVAPVVAEPQVSEGPADRRSVPRTPLTTNDPDTTIQPSTGRELRLGNQHAAPLQPGERVALPSDEYTTGSRRLRLGTPRMEAPDLGQQARAASEAAFGPMKRGGQPIEPAKQPPLNPDGTPNWPANYVKTFLQDTDKGGSNYSDADLLALKRKLGLHTERTPAAQTPEFDKWFKDSKITDNVGEPLRVYHGTRAGEDFKDFSTEGRPQTDEGEYTTSGSGADPTSYLGAHFAEEPSVANKFAQASAPWMKPRFEAGEEKPRVIPAYLNVKNPIVFDHEDGLRNYINQGKLEGHAGENLLNSLMRADGVEDPEEGGPETDAWMSKYDNDPEFRAEQHRYLFEQHRLDEGEESDLDEAAQDLARQAKSRMEAEGHDGITYKNSVEGGTSHVVFDSKQVRNALAESRPVKKSEPAQPAPKKFKKAAGGPTAKSDDLKGRLAQRLTSALA